MKILLVEDEEKLSEVVTHVLKKNKYEVDAAYDGIQAEEMICSNIYDIVILDRMLPGKDGVEVLKSIRAKNITVPVIFLTAKHTLSDRVTGLDAGADDYLTKPFANEELLARLRALSRRNTGGIKEKEEIIIGKSKFLPRNGELFFGDDYGNSLTLTMKEIGILEMLCEDTDRAVPKEELLTKLWGIDNHEDDNIIEVFISYLRKKLDKTLCGFEIITLRGRGYKINIL